jgi:prepilin-type N-terminal cleavage/methylation domain-containing protein
MKISNFQLSISNSSQGVTLIEMLIVIVIIGLLLAVVYRTIDATTYSSRFNETTKEMTELIKAFTGNPEIVSDGRRINFGYVGDMGRLPQYIDGLFRPDGANWKGPYIPSKFIEDSTGFKFDAWGDTYIYQHDQYKASIQSRGGGKQSLTMPIADSISYLFNNQISGTISDINGAPPVELSSRISIRLTVPDVAGQSGTLINYTVNPGQDGYYEFTSTNDMPVPIGYHRLVVTKQFGTEDSIVRWISVLPRSNTIADFRFATSFRNNLKYVENTGVVIGDSLNNIGFSVFNSGDSLTLDSMAIIHLDVTAYYEQAAFQGSQVWDYNNLIRAGLNTQIALNPKPVISTNSVVRFDLKGFMDDSLGLGNPIDMTNNRIAIQFSDGSVIDFIPQTSP